MFQSYIKIAFRNLWKHKLFSFINIFGLAAGMAVSILALIDLKSAYDFDLFHPYPERTYRIISDLAIKNNNAEAWASTPSQVATALRNYTFIEECVQVFPGRLEVSAGNDMLAMEVNYVDPAFFKVFGFKMLRGGYDASPYTMVLAKETAKRFFGKSDPIGKRLKQKSGAEFLVTGIIAEPEGKSHLGYGALISSATVPLLAEFKNTLADQVNYVACYTYVLLKKGVSKDVLNRVLPAIGKNASEVIPARSTLAAISFRSQVLGDISPDRQGLRRTTSGGGGGSDMGKILIQMAIGIITLLLAGFNYVNLTLARSLSRSREVGVRKVIGARQWQLVFQFVIESMILSSFALLLSFWMIQLMKPFNVVEQILHDVRWDLWLWTILISFTLLAGFLAGIIPAKLLSAFNPVSALKGRSQTMIFKGLRFRKVLVVVQFAISITGIFFMLVMYQQHKFMAEGEYGFTKENILNINLSDHDRRGIMDEIMKQPGVENVTATSAVVGMAHPNSIEIKTADKKITTRTDVQSADANYIHVFRTKAVGWH